MMLQKIDKRALAEYLDMCNQFVDFDKARAYSLINKALKYYKGDKSMKAALRQGQEIEKKWYDSLAKGKPDYSLYNDNYFMVEMWCCWVIYSRNYLVSIKKNIDKFKGVNSVMDLGCGFGYTTSALTEIFPIAQVTGTQLKNTVQYRMATELGNKYGFTIQEEVTDHADLVFASEYFEHIEAPIDHLSDVLEACTPRILVIANSFGAKSMGHFNEYIVDGALIKNKKVGRLFNQKLRDSGYKQVKTGFWNNRPAIWVK